MVCIVKTQRKCCTNLTYLSEVQSPCIDGGEGALMYDARVWWVRALHECFRGYEVWPAVARTNISADTARCNNSLS